MIYGIGTDICDVRRIQASLLRHGDRFAERILSNYELATWRQRTGRWPERGGRSASRPERPAPHVGAATGFGAARGGR